LYYTKDSKFNSWGIYNADGKFICRNFVKYSAGSERYIIQAQPHLAEQITKGNYTLKINFKEKSVNDVQISIGYSTQKKYDGYIESLKQKRLNSILPPNSTSDQWSKKGKEYVDNNDSFNAAICYEQANKLNPSDQTTIYWLGACYYFLEQYDDAIQYLEKAKTFFKNDVIKQMLGHSYYQTDNYQKAAENLSYIEKTANDYYVSGISKYKLKNYKSAFDAFKEVRKQITQDDELYATTLYYQALSQWEIGNEKPKGGWGGTATKFEALLSIIKAAELGVSDTETTIESLFTGRNDKSYLLSGTKWEKKTSSNHKGKYYEFFNNKTANGVDLDNNKSSKNKPYVFDGIFGIFNGNKVFCLFEDRLYDNLDDLLSYSRGDNYKKVK